MRKRPLIIQLIALGYVITPLVFMGQYFYFLKKPLTDAATWQLMMTPLYYKLSFLIIPPLVAYGIYKIRAWGWYLAMVHLFYVIGNNTIAYLVGKSVHPPWLIVFNSVLTLAVLLTFVRNAVRAPYFNPRIRWWENKPRYAITLDVDMGNDRTRIEAETFNISEGGMFVVSNAEINVNEKFSVKMSRDGGTSVNGEGHIVWVNPAGEKLPQGFGFMFDNLSRESLTMIRQYIKDQKKILKEKGAATPTQSVA